MRAVGKAKNYEHQILIVNGWEGTGKTAVASVLRELEGIEPSKYSLHLEWYCSYQQAENISMEAAISLIRAECDSLAYNSIYGRELNWRLRDISSVSNHPNWWKYFLRGLRSNINESEINSSLCLNLITHNLYPSADLLRAALGDRLTFVEVVRDPMFMLNQAVFNQKNCYGVSMARDFGIQYLDTSLPVADGPNARRRERGILTKPEIADEAIEFLSRRFEVLFNRSVSREEIIVNFEDFAVSPYAYLDRISNSVGKAYNKSLRRRMKAEKIPRLHHDDGRNTKDYRRVGWTQIGTAKDVASDKDRFIALYRSQGYSEENIEKLAHLSDRYIKWKGIAASPTCNT